MVFEWRFIRPCFWVIAVLFLVLFGISSNLFAQSSGSFIQSSLPFQLPAREDALEAYPCTGCHQDLPAQSTEDGATSQEHNQISVQHGGLWCLDCHEPEDRDTLRAIDHRRVGFSDMEQLCGGCHASEYRDWSKGIHGKLLGSWNGVRLGLRCVECHDAHRPEPMTLKPEPPPHHPG
ncbi:MAG: hypothetical protein AB1847_02675 [bacterium]